MLAVQHYSPTVLRVDVNNALMSGQSGNIDAAIQNL